MSGRVFSVILLPTSECNVACDYCFERKEPHRLSSILVPLLTRRLLDHLEHEDIEECEIYWQGGEAMIMGPAWFADAGKLMDSAAALVNLVACTTQSGSISLQGKPLSAYVRMTQVQAAYLGSGSAGNGVLRYKGSSYPFSVGGLGVGGIGLSKIEAKGEVYGLQR